MKKILLILCLMPTALFAEHEMKCERVGGLVRCENDEVICYTTGSVQGGVSCKFKPQENKKNKLNG